MNTKSKDSDIGTLFIEGSRRTINGQYVTTVYRSLEIGDETVAQTYAETKEESERLANLLVKHANS